MRQFTVIWFALCFYPAFPAHAHEDIDIGIAEARYDEQCRAVVTLRNEGRTLPDFFYTTLGPYVQVLAGKKHLGLFEIYELDKDRRLLSTGEETTFVAGKGGKSLPDPLKVVINIRGHWIDYNEKNNTLTKAVGCKPGQGETAGRPEKPKFADLKIASLDIDKKTCLATVVIENVNNVPLSKAAWDSDNGVTLVSINADSREHRPAVPISELDPKKKLAKRGRKIVWKDKNPVTGMEKILFGIWQVPNDPDFQNNNLQVDVPEECRAES